MMRTVIKILNSRLLYMLILGAATIFAAAMAFDGISRQADANQIEFLQNAIRRSAVQCYALEGRFPSSIGYLEDNYGLIVDRNRYNVHYESMGGNLIPQVWVFPIVQR